MLLFALWFLIIFSSLHSGPCLWFPKAVGNWWWTERGARAVTEWLGSRLWVHLSPRTFKVAAEAVAGRYCLCHEQGMQMTVNWCLGMDWVIKRCDHAATWRRQTLPYCNFKSSLALARGSSARALVVWALSERCAGLISVSCGNALLSLPGSLQLSEVGGDHCTWEESQERYQKWQSDQEVWLTRKDQKSCRT